MLQGNEFNLSTVSKMTFNINPSYLSVVKFHFPPFFCWVGHLGTFGFGHDDDEDDDEVKVCLFPEDLSQR